MHEQLWVRIVGSGRAHQGPAHIDGIIFTPDATSDYVDVYDGRDAESGKKFCRITTSVKVTWQFQFPAGVHFDVGIYLAGIDAAVETTVLFTPE